MASTHAREPAVAGLFYPGRGPALAREVDRLLANAGAPAGTGDAVAPLPKALIVPHAGYAFSGPVAASGYARLAAGRDDVNRIVLIGPAHRAALAGLAVPSVDALRTPLGDVAIDAEARDRVAALSHVAVDDGPHDQEHSLEVHVPFLQRTLANFTILPLVVGTATADAVADVLEAVWDGPETVVIVSTDLSHYEPHEDATTHDTRTVAAVLDGRVDAIGPYDACGRYPLAGFLRVADRHGLRPELLDRRTSGDTSGPRDRVVGYAAIAYV